MPEATLPGLVADLVALRHAGGYKFKVPERVLRQFAQHCEREGYPDGSITKEALDGFLYGRHLRSSTVRAQRVGATSTGSPRPRRRLERLHPGRVNP